MAKRDMFSECYTGDQQRIVSPEDFRRVICQRCRNPECSNSALGKSLWINRMETQADILLDNPLFADPNDPRYQAFREMNFADMARQAVALEVSAQRGDWEIPSDAEVEQMVQQMGVAPVGFQPEEPEPEPALEPEPEPEPEMLWEGTAKGKKGAIYAVTLADLGDGNPVWSCTCPNFQYRKAPPEGCKHIVEARDLYMQAQMAEAETVVEDEAPAPPEEPTERKPRDIDPEAWSQMRERGHVPRAPNTRFPNEGMMVDGSPAPPETPPEPEDPWAVPTKPEGDVVEVHGKVRMGGGKPK